MTAMTPGALHRILDTVRTGDEGTVTITRPGYVGVYTGTFNVSNKCVYMDTETNACTARYGDGRISPSVSHVEIVQRKVTLPTEPGTVVVASTQEGAERGLFVRDYDANFYDTRFEHSVMDDMLMDPVVQRLVPADKADELIAEARKVLGKVIGGYGPHIAQRVLDAFGVTEP